MVPRIRLRRKGVSEEVPLMMTTCGSPIIPAKGDYFVRKGALYHVEDIVWYHDKDVVIVHAVQTNGIVGDEQY